MSNLTEIKESVKSTNKIWQPKQDKQWKLIQDYKKYDFNYQSVLRINNNYR